MIPKNKTLCNRTGEQFNGREGETATLLSRCLVTLNLRGGGFAPRHLNRSAFLGEMESFNNQTDNYFADCRIDGDLRKLQR